MAISVERRAARQRHIVDAAQALIRERGDAGFTMTELAARAGVSPATPYNLVGSKADLLNLVVDDEFETFARKLASMRHDSALGLLLDATALVVVHYEADRRFYRGLFRSAFGVDATEVRDLMAARGLTLWQGFVQGAIDTGEIEGFARAGPLTEALLRMVSVTVQAWLAEGWDERRFGLEMANGVRLVVASVAAPAVRERLVGEIRALQDDICRLVPEL